MQKKKKTSQGVWIAAIVAALLLVTVLGYFMLVSPERAVALDCLIVLKESA